MITFFSVPRQFDGEIEITQRMAIQSWLSVAAGSEVILFGDEHGVAEASEEFGTMHCPISKNEYGTPLFNDAFTTAESLAGNEYLCEISADIIISGEITTVIEAISELPRPFVIGQRTDIDPGVAPETAVLHSPAGIDYFLYRKGTIGRIPPFAVGRTAYDNWMVWRAVTQGMTVIDATHDLLAIHVNHDYPNFADMAIVEEERRENVRLARETGCNRWYGVNDAPYVLKSGKIERRKE